MAQYETYVVKGGDTLSKIAASKGVPLAELVRLNALSDPDRINVGQVLSIRRLTETVYVVQRGDTLSAIAGHYRIPLSALIAANQIADPNRLEVDQKLVIPSLDAVPAPPPPPPARRSGGPIAPGALSVKAAQLAEKTAQGRRSQGKCYRFVKLALLNSGAVDEYLAGASAINAGPILERDGFVDLLHDDKAGIKSPYDAPVGAVLVYRATPTSTDRNRIHGHIEIRTANGFASDYFSPRARTGPRENGLTLLGPSGRTLDGVYVKPDAPAAGAAAAPPPPPPAESTAAGAGDNRYSAANLSLGPNGLYEAAIVEAARRTSLAPQTVAAIINAEAAKKPDGQWDANSKAKTSSASGLTQFLDGTWVAEATRKGGLLNAEAKAAGLVSAANQVVDRLALLRLRFDPRFAILAGADFAVSNISAMRAAGAIAAQVDPGGLAKLAYLAHHDGSAGAMKFLRGNMSYLSATQFEANVPASQRADFLKNAGGNKGLAYRAWLTGYVDRNIDVRKFMKDVSGVNVPNLASFFR
ncbi:MAG: LysM peptidoglycan-binding domain-containing protein [Allosphingosinicella sp.]